MECLSNSSLEFRRWIIGSLCSSLSSSWWNWSISASRDRREEAVSSFGAATSQGGQWRGNSTSGRSSQARKSGMETSIRASQGSPALIAWPTSWN